MLAQSMLGVSDTLVCVPHMLVVVNVPPFLSYISNNTFSTHYLRSVRCRPTFCCPSMMMLWNGVT
jgi:hypothetical protein